MTLKQAFTMWACIPQNTVLAAKSRDAVQRVLMKKHGDFDIEVFTENFCRRLFSQCREMLEMQVKAASILVYVLQWGCDNGHCQRPTFTYVIASEEYKKRNSPADEQKPVRTPIPKTLAEISGRSVMPAETKETENNKTETTMEQETKKAEQARPKGKPRGQAPRPVVQIDPTTLEAVREWPSMAEAANALGCLSGNIHRAVTQLRTAGGFYWSDPENVAQFKDTLAHKKSTPRSTKALRSALKREKKPAKPKEEKPAKPKDEKPKTEESQQEQGLPNKQGLAQYTDDELANELKRRGWQGNLTKSLEI